MYKKSILSIAIASSLMLTGCFENNKLDDENAGAQPNALTQEQLAALQAEAGTYPIFNPITTEFPVPNDLMVDRKPATADGTYVASNKLAALDYLDGAGTSSSYDIPTSGTLLASSVVGESFIPAGPGGMYIPNPNQTVFLLDLTYPGGDELISTPGVDINADGKADLTEIPTFQAGLIYSSYSAAFQAWAANPTDPTLTATKNANEAALLKNTGFRADLITLDGTESVIRISPKTPLNPKSKYLVVVTNGVLDVNGDPIKASPSYKGLAGTGPLLSPALQGARDAIGGWERLATGWFNATTNSVRQQLGGSGAGLPDLDASNIALSVTFTTGGTDTVLNAMVAPETFLIEKATITAKQAGITALFTGGINFTVAGSPLPADDRDSFFYQLTAASTTSPLYIAKIADGTYTSYISMVTDPNVSSTDLFKAQTAAATANLSVENGDAGPGAGNGTAIADTASTTAAQLVGGGILTRPTSGIKDKNSDTNITYHDTFIPYPLLKGAPATGTVNDYRLDSQTTFGLPNPGYVMQGQIEVPYFLPDASADGTPNALNTGTWTANSFAGLGAPSSNITYRFPFAAKQKTENIPFLLSVPKVGGPVTKPANGWPVVIFQHGIFGARGHSIPMANQLGYGCAAGGGAQCFATIAIDLPLHGLAPNSIRGDADSLTDAGLNVDVQGAPAHSAWDWDAVSSQLPSDYSGLHERHFGWSKTSSLNPTPSAMDYASNTADPANGYSGEYYINLGLPTASRDNLRQSALDLSTLIASLEDINIDDAGADLDTSRVYLVGHSLGGMVSTVFSAVNNNPEVQKFTQSPVTLQAVALENSGGNIMRVLENSPTFGPGILAGLSAATDGVVVPGTSSFETFMNIAQAAIESGDSINFASSLASSTHSTPILATEIYGDGIDRATQDDTIPLGVDEVDDTTNMLTDYFAPASSLAQNATLAGSEPFFNEMGLSSLTTSVAPATEIQGVVRFNTGTHTNIILPNDNLSVFGEMASQLVSFFSTNGTGINVGTINPTVISSADPDVSK